MKRTRSRTRTQKKSRKQSRKQRTNSPLKIFSFSFVPPGALHEVSPLQIPNTPNPPIFSFEPPNVHESKEFRFTRRTRSRSMSRSRSK